MKRPTRPVSGAGRNLLSEGDVVPLEFGEEYEPPIPSYTGPVAKDYEYEEEE